MDNEKSKNRTKKILTFIAIIIIILIILSMHSCVDFDRVNNLVPLGNIDIFDITIDKSCCDKTDCECDCQKENPSKIIPAIKEDKEISDNDDEEIIGANILDQDGIYGNRTDLRIFSNPTYEFKNIIAPLSTNVYQFIVRNNNDFDIKYRLKMIEDNQYNINMKYRLKLNYRYVKGNENSWVTYDELQFNDLNLISHGRDVYQLEWKWFESSNDTYIGSIEADYSLKISFDGEELL